MDVEVVVLCEIAVLQEVQIFRPKLPKLVVLEKQTDFLGGGGSTRPFKKSADIKSLRPLLRVEDIVPIKKRQGHLSFREFRLEAI
eukprot:scaffold21639_cov51-Cyclotella_meneghiniana.AAC.3